MAYQPAGELSLFRIWDSKQNAYWVSPKGKHVWDGRGLAKNAWNCACSWGGRGKFDDQPELEVHEFALVKTAKEGVKS